MRPSAQCMKTCVRYGVYLHTLSDRDVFVQHHAFGSVAFQVRERECERECTGPPL